MTHESQYDNMNAFLRTNGFDEIYAQENYPRIKSLTALVYKTISYINMPCPF